MWTPHLGTPASRNEINVCCSGATQSIVLCSISLQWLRYPLNSKDTCASQSPGGLVGLHPRRGWVCRSGVGHFSRCCGCCWSGNHSLRITALVSMSGTEVLKFCYILLSPGNVQNPQMENFIPVKSWCLGMEPMKFKTMVSTLLPVCDLRAVHSDMTPIMTYRCTRAIPGSLTLLRRHIHSLFNWQLFPGTRLALCSVLGVQQWTAQSRSRILPELSLYQGRKTLIPTWAIISYGVIK